MSDFPFKEHRSLAEAWRDQLYYWRHREEILERQRRRYNSSRWLTQRDIRNDKNQWEETPPSWPDDTFRF